MRSFFTRHSLGAALRPLRLVFVMFVLAAGFASVTAPAMAATPAEQFIGDNVQHGLSILNNKSLSKEQRRSQFQEFLVGLTDIKAIAEYTLGQYRRTATPAQIATFDEAFKHYALAVYQTYFNKFSGQTLQVTGSYPLASDETVVKTIMIDPAKSNDPNPLQVNFRVSTASGRTAVVDFSVAGVWLRETERSDFTSVLGQKNGDVSALSAILETKAQQQR